MARVAKQNVREKILEAAERRLWHYGIKKTTIDEIAADAGVGKGTVYLYFDSKEDISLAIFVGYKLGVLGEQEKIVASADLDTETKIHDFLLFPVVTAQTKCQLYPEAVEIITVLKPHLAEHLRPYVDREIGLLEKILIEGNESGVLVVEDPASTARSLKLMTMGFMPPFPCINDPIETQHEIQAIVRLTVRGMRCNASQVGTEAK